jgi:hypothetical protein
MLRQKVLQYFFILAAVLSILDGAFILQPTMQSIKYIVLIVSGIIVGMLVAQDHKQILISGIAYLLGILVISQFLGTVVFLSGIQTMLFNLAIFVAMAIVVIGIEQFVSLLTSEKQNEQIIVKTRNKVKEAGKKELENKSFEKIWARIILVAVGLTFIILLAELFFNLGKLEITFLILDLIITILFIVDVIMLYVKSKSFGYFIRNHIFDIISAIPLVGVLRGLKLIRAVKIIKAAKIAKVLNINKTTKMFSEKGSFNEIKSKKAKKMRTSKATGTSYKASKKRKP